MRDTPQYGGCDASKRCIALSSPRYSSLQADFDNLRKFKTGEASVIWMQHFMWISITIKFSSDGARMQIWQPFYRNRAFQCDIKVTIVIMGDY